MKSIDRTTPPQSALVIHPVRRGGEVARAPQARLEEAAGLARALDLVVAGAMVAPLRSATPATLFGPGKVAEIAEACKEAGIDVVVVDDHLSPIQQRNLERAWQVKVIDRTGLILEIFARRARTKEGRLQVELARLDYERSRLVRTWTHLERQRGGFGFLGGPGETQIEADRRLIVERIVKLKAELADVRRTRGLARRARKRVPYPTIALVGYTNAGKSTLFNRLTNAKVLAKSMLFATLDPTLRRVRLPGGRPAILSDTVGFISDLPHELVESFRATLDEVREADIILHVRDISGAHSEAEAQDVAKVLDELDLVPEAERRLVEVWNKIDLIGAEAREDIAQHARRAGAVPLSAETGEGIDELLERLAALVDDSPEIMFIWPIPTARRWPGSIATAESRPARKRPVAHGCAHASTPRLLVVLSRCVRMHTGVRSPRFSVGLGLRGFGGIPQFIHFGEGRVRGCAPIFGQPLLDMAEAADELGVRGAQGVLRVDVQLPRQVGADEQHVAQFGVNPRLVARRHLGLQLGDLLVQLGHDLAKRRPREADPRGAGRQLHRPGQRRGPMGTSSSSSPPARGCFAARSFALISSQAAVCSRAVRTTASPNTCG